MNALKHGLDAQTLILPGEDEAAHRARLDAWTAAVRPRDAGEEAMVEEAVRLSWQLDRADRVQAATLVERYRIAAEDRAARPEREAAEAARIGERLLAGPPEEPAPRGQPDEEIAGRTFRARLHPDDPDHPHRLLSRLKANAAGCRWLLDRWAELRAILADDPAAWWGSAERVRAVRLLGKDPFDAVDDREIGAIYLCSFQMDPAGPRVYDEQAIEVTKTEFRIFIDRLRGRRAGKRVPPDRESARQELLARVDGVMAGLRAMESAHADREAALAEANAAGLAFDDSPEGERIRRLQLRLSNKVFRAMGVLLKIQHRRTADPAHAVPAADSPGLDGFAASPVVTIDSFEVRNEPNEPAAALRNEPNEPAAALRNEPNEPAAALRNEPTVAGRGLDPRGRPDDDATERTQRAPGGAGEAGPRRDGTNPSGPRPEASGRRRTDGPGLSWTPSLPVPPLQVQPPRADRKRGVRPPPRPLSRRTQ